MRELKSMDWIPFIGIFTVVWGQPKPTRGSIMLTWAVYQFVVLPILIGLILG